MTPYEVPRPNIAPDPLDPWERSVIGKAGQIRLPLPDPADLNRVAVILRDLANKLEVLSKNRHDTPFAILSRAKFEISAAQARVSREKRDRAIRQTGFNPREPKL